MKKYFLPLYALLVLVALVLTFKEMMPTKRVPTYLVTGYEKRAVVEKKLSQSGFEILGHTTLAKSKVEVVVFTHESLKELALKEKRGFVAGVLRVTLDKENKSMRFSNPNYFLQAFMQEDYTDETSEKLLEMLHTAYPHLEASKDKLKETKLSNFTFMMGMPGYTNTWELAQGTQEELLETLHKKAKKDLIFELKLSDSTTIVGVTLKKRTMKFIDKIGAQNASVLPWMVLIQNGKAVAMDAKYQIALYYPLLTMGTFMTISTVPGAVEKELAKYFK